MKWRAVMASIGGAFFLALSGCGAQDTTTLGSDMARALGVIHRGTCSLEPLVANVGHDCTPLAGTVIASPQLDVGAAAAAFDGDACRSFHAGNQTPAWVGLDFGSAHKVTDLLLSTRSDGPATHAVEISDDGAEFSSVVVLTGELLANQGYTVSFSEPLVTRYLRVSTTQSPTPVAWREIVPLACQ